ncbi:MAG: hypothetical protein KBG15_05840 [Kofleriaceae bacterium]|nr:hypothetical protein [Kofleriaceae bacterium]
MGNRDVPERSTLRRQAVVAYARKTEAPPKDTDEDPHAASKIAEQPTLEHPIVPRDRPRQATVAMAQEPDLGEPPAMPEARVAPTVVRPSTETNYFAVEDPTHMPHPRDLPSGFPTDAARPPGMVPRGDSRSLRRGTVFALVYRLGTYVITRTGEIGQRGVWRVVDYPTTIAGSGAYAREASRWVDAGFTDFRG